MTRSPSLLKNRDYMLWFIGDTIADFGSFIRNFAMPLITLAVTGSLSTAGLVGAASAIAMASTLLPGGLLADRLGKRKLLIMGHLYGVLIWGGGVGLYYAGHLNAVWLIIIGLLTGIRSGIFGAVSNAAIKQLVPSPALPTAIAANQGREAVLGLASGPVGGFLVALSTGAPFIAECLGHMVSTLTTWGIRNPLDPAANQTGEPITWKTQLKDGARWLGDNRVVLWLVVVASLLNLGLNGTLTTIILQLRTDGIHPGVIGLVSSAMGVGILVGALAAPKGIRKVRLGTIFVYGISWMVLMVVLAAFIRQVVVLMVLIALAAFTFPLINSGLGAYVMNIVPDSKVGAITATMGLVSLGLMPFAPLIAGFGLDHLGYVPTVSILAGLLASSVVIAVAVPTIRHLQLPQEAQQVELAS